MPEPAIALHVEGLAAVAYTEFNETLDYIWKAPLLLDHLKRVEARKAIDYFRDDPQMLRWRWSHESRKLAQVFPPLIAHGNLFLVSSLFEAFMLRLVTQAWRLGVSTRARPRAGVAGHLEQLRHAGVNTARLSFWSQVNAALKIRHCLMHAGGYLAASRDDRELRRVVSSRTYLARDHRLRTGEREPTEPDVAIVPGTLGDVLTVRNGYAWIACAYMRDYIVSACAAVARVAGVAAVPPN